MHLVKISFWTSKPPFLITLFLIKYPVLYVLYTSGTPNYARAGLA